MRFSSIFAPRTKPHPPEIDCDSLAHTGSAAGDSLVSPSPTPQPISGHPNLSQPASAETALFNFNWFLPTQAAWLNDPWPLKIWEKSRQVGATKTDALDSVLKASHADAKFDVWVIRHNGNPMGWHLYSYPIQKAVEEGIVERINEKSGRDETREAFLKRTRAECIDEEQWLQEYCCQPADDNSAFFSYEMITSCVDQSIKLMSLQQLLKYCEEHPLCALYMGVDVGRTKNLFVIDVGEKVGDVMWDRTRIELDNRPFGEMEENLYPLLALPQLKRCCMDSMGNGSQLHERAKERFGWKAEGIKFTSVSKEEMAFALRAGLEDRKLRLVSDDALRSDLRALKKEITASGNIRLEGNFENSHCDRTWAKALRQHAARYRPSAGGAVA